MPMSSSPHVSGAVTYLNITAHLVGRAIDASSLCKITVVRDTDLLQAKRVYHAALRRLKLVCVHAMVEVEGWQGPLTSPARQVRWQTASAGASTKASTFLVSCHHHPLSDST
jgi:hypothetical protein